jgi:anthranilate synthase/aminodeoxychorismate synthase-like glutamine amidotransferase
LNHEVEPRSHEGHEGIQSSIDDHGTDQNKRCERSTSQGLFFVLFVASWFKYICPRFFAPLQYRPMILLIDNYDSFTYNIVQRIGEMDATLDIQVHRNDKIDADTVEKLKPDHIIVSPGPCSPNEAAVSNDIITRFAGRIPLFGVCLGHQCIGHNFGMTVTRNYRLMHGKVSPIHHDGRSIFKGVSNPFDATRYHSLVILREGFDHSRFEITAWTDENEIMGVRAKPGSMGPGRNALLEGVQFHPESFLTLEGPKLLANFLGLPAPKTLAV